MYGKQACIHKIQYHLVKNSTLTTLNMIVSYDILCHYGNFLGDTSYK